MACYHHLTTINVKTVPLLFMMFLTATAVSQQPSSRRETPDVVWTWSKQCNDNHKLGVTVRLDHNVLYRVVIPICRGSRGAEDGRAEFHFNADHLFQGEYRTRTTDSIEGDIWQAGGEADALVLGISFDTKQQVLLNTVHIAKPDRQVSSELDKGLFITTYPVHTR